MQPLWAESDTPRGALLDEHTSEYEALIEMTLLISFMKNVNPQRSSGQLEHANMKCTTTGIVIERWSNNFLQRIIPFGVIQSELSKDKSETASPRIVARQYVLALPA